MKRAKKIITFIVMLVLCIMPVTGCSLLKGEEEFVVKEHLDDVIVKIDDEEFTFEDIGYYIANGEAAVQSQALIYNPDNPEEYWNKHTNGIFIKVQARQNVMDNFVRDTVLAMSANKEGLSLSDADMENCKTSAKGLYEQLSDFQREEAGITEENLCTALENAYLGQMYIEYRLESPAGEDYTSEDWQLDGVCYKGLLSEYKVKVITDTWEKAEFGKITIEKE